MYPPAGKYKDALLRDCCLDGMRMSPLTYTCERRGEYITDGEACAQAFVHCCKVMEIQRAESQEENLQLARSKGPDKEKGWIEVDVWCL